MSKTTTKNKIRRIIMSVLLVLGLSAGLLGVAVNSPFIRMKEAVMEENTVLVTFNGDTVSGVGSALDVTHEDGGDVYIIKEARHFIDLMTNVLTSTNTTKIRLETNVKIVFDAGNGAIVKTPEKFIFQINKPKLTENVVFDGNGFQINFDNSVTFVNGGFFSIIEQNAIVKNLSYVFNGMIQKGTAGGTFGSFCDVAAGSFTDTNLYMNGQIDFLLEKNGNLPTSEDRCIGGIIGRSSSNFTNCILEFNNLASINYNDSNGTQGNRTIGGIFGRLEGSFEKCAIRSNGKIMNFITVNRTEKSMTTAGFAGITTGSVSITNSNIYATGSIEADTQWLIDSNEQNASWGKVSGDNTLGALFGIVGHALTLTTNKIDINNASVKTEAILSADTNKAYAGRIAGNVTIDAGSVLISNNILINSPERVSATKRKVSTKSGNKYELQYLDAIKGSFFGGGKALIGENNWVFTTEKFENTDNKWNTEEHEILDNQGNVTGTVNLDKFADNDDCDKFISKNLNRVVTYGAAHIDPIIRDGKIYFAPQVYELVSSGQNATPFDTWLLGNPNRGAGNKGIELSTDNTYKDYLVMNPFENADEDKLHKDMPVFSPNGNLTDLTISALHMFSNISKAYELTQFAEDTNSGMNYGWVKVTLVEGKDYIFDRGLAPIGTSKYPFKGVFEGSNANIKFNKGSDIAGRDNIGLFGVNEGIIRNFNLEFNGEMRLKKESDETDIALKNNIGVLVGLNKGTIDNIDVTIGSGVKMYTDEIVITDANKGHNYSIGGAIGKQTHGTVNSVFNPSTVKNMNVKNYAQSTVVTAKGSSAFTINSYYGGVFGTILGGYISCIAVEVQGSMMTSYVDNNNYHMGGFAGYIDAAVAGWVKIDTIGISIGASSIINPNFTIFNPQQGSIASVMNFAKIGNFAGRIDSVNNISSINNNSNYYTWISKYQDNLAERNNAGTDSAKTAAEQKDEIMMAYVFAHNDVPGYYSSFSGVTIKDIGTADGANNSSIAGADKLKSLNVSAPKINKNKVDFTDVNGNKESKEIIIRDIAVLTVELWNINRIKFARPTLKNDYVFTGWYDSDSFTSSVSNADADIDIVVDGIAIPSISPKPDTSKIKFYTRIISNKIFSVEDLNVISNLVNSSNGKVTFAGIFLELVENIVITGNYTPIGNSGTFQGDFNGNAKSITFDGSIEPTKQLFSINSNSIGLFGKVGSNAKIYNLSVVFKDINTNFAKRFGGIADINEGTIGSSRQSDKTIVKFSNCIIGTYDFGGIVNRNQTDLNNIGVKRPGIVTGVAAYYENTKITGYNSSFLEQKTVYMGGAIAFNDADVAGLIVYADDLSSFTLFGRQTVCLGGVIGYNNHDKNINAYVINVVSDIKAGMVIKHTSTNDSNFKSHLGLVFGGMADEAAGRLDSGAYWISNAFAVDNGLKSIQSYYESGSVVVPTTPTVIKTDGSDTVVSNKIGVYVGDNPAKPTVYGTFTVNIAGDSVEFIATEKDASKPFSVWRATDKDNVTSDLLPTHGANNTTFRPSKDTKNQFRNSKILIYFVKTEIITANDWINVAKDVALGYNPVITYTVGGDITFAANSLYTRIGTSEYPFAGQINGHSRTLYFGGVNPYTTGGVGAGTYSDFNGVFGYIASNAMLSQLNIEIGDMAISSKDVNGFGIVAYSNLGTISQVIVKIDTEITAKNKFGGVVAINNSFKNDNDDIITGKIYDAQILHTHGKIGIITDNSNEITFGYVAALNNGVIGQLKTNPDLEDILVRVEKGHSDNVAAQPPAVFIMKTNNTSISSIILGGIVGINKGSVNNTKFELKNGAIFASKEEKVGAVMGGIAGTNYGLVKNSIVNLFADSAMFSYGTDSIIGGVVGAGYDKSILDTVTFTGSGYFGMEKGGTIRANIVGGIVGTLTGNAYIKKINAEFNSTIYGGAVAAGLVGVANKPNTISDDKSEKIKYIDDINITLNGSVDAISYAAGLVGKNASNINSVIITVNEPIKAHATVGSFVGGLIADNQIEDAGTIGYISNVLLNLNAKVQGQTVGLMAGISYDGIAKNCWVLTLNDTRLNIANKKSNTTIIPNIVSGFSSMKVIDDTNKIVGSITNGQLKFTVPKNIRGDVSFYGWYKDVSNGTTMGYEEGALTEPNALGTYFYTFEPKVVKSENVNYHVSFVKLNVSSTDDLDAITRIINSVDVFFGVRISLENDLEFGEGKMINPIGTRNAPFSGVFEGNYKKITISAGASISSGKENDIGLFGTIGKDGLVRNLNVAVGEGVYLMSGSTDVYYGVFAGVVEGKLENILINAHSTPQGSSKNGAFAGKMTSTATAENVWVITYNSSLNTTAEGAIGKNGEAMIWEGARGINKLSVIGDGDMNAIMSGVDNQITISATSDTVQNNKFYKWLANPVTGAALTTKSGFGTVVANEDNKITYAPHIKKNGTVSDVMFTISFINLEITDVESYENFVANVNSYSGLQNTTFRLMNDLVIKGTAESPLTINPIGTNKLPFEAIFDGACTKTGCTDGTGKPGHYHKIVFDNVLFNGDFSAMFGYVQGGVIKNLTVETRNNSFTYQYLDSDGKHEKPSTYAAGLVALFNGTAENVVVVYERQNKVNSSHVNSFAGSFSTNAVAVNTWVVINQELNIGLVNSDINGNNTVNSLIHAGAGKVGVVNSDAGIKFTIVQDKVNAYLSKNGREFSEQNSDYQVQTGTNGKTEENGYTINSDGIRITEDGKAIYNSLTILFAKLDITSAADLVNLATQINKGINYDGITYKLGNDIVVTKNDVEKGLFIPIGGVVGTRYDGQMSFFSGRFDGNGKTITLEKEIAMDNVNSALFGLIDGTASITNLIVKSSATIGNKDTRYAAILVAESKESKVRVGAQIENVVVYANQGTKITANTLSAYCAAKYDGNVKDVWVIAVNNKYTEDVIVNVISNDNAQDADGVNLITILGGGNLTVSVVKNVDRTFTFTPYMSGQKKVANGWYYDFTYTDEHMISTPLANKFGDSEIVKYNGSMKLETVGNMTTKGVKNARLAVDFLTRELESDIDVFTLANQVNIGYSFYGIEITLKNDIVIKSKVLDKNGKLLGSLSPIGTKDNPFVAIFNGNTHSIKLTDGVKLADFEYSGLFGYVGENAVIKNIKLTADDVYIAGTYVATIDGKTQTKGSTYAGLIAYNEGKLENVIFETYGIKVAADDSYKTDIMLGLAIGGSSSLDIKNCWSIVTTNNSVNSVYKNQNISLNEMTVIGRGEIEASYYTDDLGKIKIVLAEKKIDRKVVKDASGNIISNVKNVNWYYDYAQNSAISSGGEGIVGKNGEFSFYKPSEGLSNKRYEVTLIYTSLVDVQDLNAIAYDINNGGYIFSGITFSLVTDIVINTGSNVAIGKKSNVFKGTLDGNGHKFIYKNALAGAEKKEIIPLFDTSTGRVINISIDVDSKINHTSDTPTAFIARNNKGDIMNSTINVKNKDNDGAAISIITKNNFALVAVTNAPTGLIENTKINIDGQIVVGADLTAASFGAISVLNQGKIDTATIIYTGSVSSTKNTGGSVAVNELEMRNIVVRLFTQETTFADGEYVIKTNRENRLQAGEYVGGLVAINKSLVENSVIYAIKGNIMSTGTGEKSGAGIVAGTCSNDMANVWAILLYDDNGTLKLSSDLTDTTKANILVVNGDGIVEATASNGKVTFANGGYNKTIYGWYNLDSKLNIKTDPNKYGNIDGDSYYPSETLRQVSIIVEFVMSSIKSVANWNDIARYINSGYSSADIEFKLDSSFEVDATCTEFLPIGTEKNPFNYSFNGGGKTITINTDVASLGFGNLDFNKNFALFGYLGANAVIKNLNIVVNSNIGSSNGSVPKNESVALIATENRGTIDGVNIHIMENCKLLGKSAAAFTINNYGDIKNSKLNLDLKSSIEGVYKAAGVTVKHSGKTIDNVDVSIKGTIIANKTISDDDDSYAAGFACDNNAKIENVIIKYGAENARETQGKVIATSTSRSFASGFICQNSGIINGVQVIDLVSNSVTDTTLIERQPIVSASSTLNATAIGFIYSNTGAVSTSYIRFDSYAVGASSIAKEIGIASDKTEQSKVFNFWVVTDKIEKREPLNKKVNYMLTKSADIDSKISFIGVEFKIGSIIKGGLASYDFTLAFNVSTISDFGIIAYQTERFSSTNEYKKTGVVGTEFVSYNYNAGKTGKYTPSKDTAGKIVRPIISNSIDSSEEYYTMVKYINVFNGQNLKLNMSLGDDIIIDIANKNFAQINMGTSSLSLSNTTSYNSLFLKEVGNIIEIQNTGSGRYIPLFSVMSDVTLFGLQFNVNCDISGANSEAVGILAKDAYNPNIQETIINAQHYNLQVPNNYVLFENSTGSKITFTNNTIIYSTSKTNITKELLNSSLNFIAINGDGLLNVRNVRVGGANTVGYFIENDVQKGSVYAGYTNNKSTPSTGKPAISDIGAYHSELKIVIDYIGVIVYNQGIASYVSRWNALKKIYGSDFEVNFAKAWLISEGTVYTGDSSEKFKQIVFESFNADIIPEIIQGDYDSIKIGFLSYDTIKMRNTPDGDETTVTGAAGDEYKLVYELWQELVTGNAIYFKRYTTEIKSLTDWLNVVNDCNNLDNNYEAQEISLRANLDLSGSIAGLAALKNFKGNLTSKGGIFDIILNESLYLIENLETNAKVYNINLKSSKAKTVNFIKNRRDGTLIDVKVVLNDNNIKDGHFIIWDTKTGDATYVSEVIGKTKLDLTYGVGNDSITLTDIAYKFYFNEITNTNDWNLLAAKVDNFSGIYAGITIKLANDITLNLNDKTFKTLGNSGNFAGIFDGNNHTISVTGDKQNYLFGSVTGKIVNLNVKYIGQRNSMLLVSDNRGTVSNVTVESDMMDPVKDNALIFWYNIGISENIVEKNTNKKVFTINEKYNYINLSFKTNEIASEREFIIFANSTKGISAKDYTGETIVLKSNIEKFDFTKQNSLLSAQNDAYFTSLFDNFRGTIDGNYYKVSFDGYVNGFTMFANNTNTTNVKNLLIELPKKGQNADNVVNKTLNGATFTNVNLLKEGRANKKASDASYDMQMVAPDGNDGVRVLAVDGEGMNRYAVGRVNNGGNSAFSLSIYPYSVLGTNGNVGFIWVPQENATITHTNIKYSGWYSVTGNAAKDYEIDSYVYSLFGNDNLGLINFAFSDKYLLQAFSGNGSTHLRGLGIYAPGESAIIDLSEIDNTAPRGRSISSALKYAALANYMLQDASSGISFENGVIKYEFGASGTTTSVKLNFKQITGATAQIFGYSDKVSELIKDKETPKDGNIRYAYTYYSVMNGSSGEMTERPSKAGIYNFKIEVYNNDVLIGVSTVLQIKINKANIFTSVKIESKQYDKANGVLKPSYTAKTYGLDQVLYNNLSFVFDNYTVGKHKIKVVGDIDDRSGGNYQIEKDANGYLMVDGVYIYGEITKKQIELSGDLKPIIFTYDATYLNLDSMKEIATITIGGVVIKVVNHMTAGMLKNGAYLVTIGGAEFYAVMAINPGILGNAGVYQSQTNGQYAQFMCIPADESSYIPISLNTGSQIVDIRRGEIRLEAKTSDNDIIEQVYGQKEESDKYHSVFRIFALDLKGIERDITDSGIIILTYSRIDSANKNVGMYDIMANIFKKNAAGETYNEFEKNNPNYTLVFEDDSVPVKQYIAKNRYKIVARNMLVKSVQNGSRYYSISGTQPIANFKDDTSGSDSKIYYPSLKGVTVNVVPVYKVGENTLYPLTDMNVAVGKYGYRFDFYETIVDADGKSKKQLINGDNFNITCNDEYSVETARVSLVEHSVIIISRYTEGAKLMASIEYNLKEPGIRGKTIMDGIGNDAKPRVFTSKIELPALTNDKLSNATISLENSNVVFANNTNSILVKGDEVTTGVEVNITSIKRQPNKIYRESIDFNIDNYKEFFDFKLKDDGTLNDIAKLVGFQLINYNNENYPYIIPKNGGIDVGTYALKLTFMINRDVPGWETAKFKGFTEALKPGETPTIPAENYGTEDSGYTMTLIIPNILTVSPKELKIDLTNDNKLTYGTLLTLKNVGAIIKDSNDNALNDEMKDDMDSIKANIKYSRTVIGTSVKIDLVAHKIPKLVNELDEKGNIKYGANGKAIKKVLMEPDLDADGNLQYDEAGKLKEKEVVEEVYALNPNYLIKKENIIAGQINIERAGMEYSIKICGVDVDLTNKSKPIIINANSEGKYPTFILEVVGSSRNGLKNGDKIKTSGGHKVSVYGLAANAFPKEGKDYTLVVEKDRGIKIVAANGRTEVTKNYVFEDLATVLEGIKIHYVGGKAPLPIWTLIIVIAGSVAVVVLILLVVGILTRKSKIKKLMILIVPTLEELNSIETANEISTTDSSPDGEVNMLDSPDVSYDTLTAESPKYMTETGEENAESSEAVTEMKSEEHVSKIIEMHMPVLTEDNSDESLLGEPMLGTDEDGPIVIESKTKKKTPAKKAKK